MTGIASPSAGRQSAGEVTYRSAREDDLPATARVFKGALNELYGRHNLPLVETPEDKLVPYHRHLLRHDGERFSVAELDGSIVGFGAGIVRDDWWYLAALFVLPEAQGRGVGRTLIERAKTGTPPISREATITDALQPVSNTLYARHGLVPWLPIVGLAGRPSPVSARVLPKGCEAVPLDARLLADVRDVDQRVTGLDRSVDHEFLLAEGERHGWLLCRDGRPEGYVYVNDRGLVGPAAATRRGAMTSLMGFALATLHEHGAESVYAAVPGPDLEAQRVLLQAGLVYGACPGLLLVSRPFGRFDRYVIASYGLM